jgi:hypothetical protein
MVSLTPITPSFGSHTKEPPDKAKIVTLTNTGDAALKIRSMKTLGAIWSDFTLRCEPDREYKPRDQHDVLSDQWDARFLAHRPLSSSR